tara:strand:+ start:72 stop:557 length:486 start_codon:yes stop_codon:yes gene_type:complete
MNDISETIKDLMSLSVTKNIMISTAESCTAGLISKYLTDIPGASKFYASSVIAYSNKSKSDLLGVSKESLSIHGAVSENVVIAMTEGLLQLTNSTVVVAVSGIMGPKSDISSKKVGEVWFCWKHKDKTKTLNVFLSGSRLSNREEAAKIAILGLYDFIKEI